MSCPVMIGTNLLDNCRPAEITDDDSRRKSKEFKERLAKDPMHLKRVRISALAAIRLITHAQRGVLEGLADADRGNTPVEVMGELIGFVDPSDNESLVISDVFSCSMQRWSSRSSRR